MMKIIAIVMKINAVVIEMIAIMIKIIVIMIKMMPRCKFDQILKKSLSGSPGASTQPGGQSAPGIRSDFQIYQRERKNI